MLQDLLEVGGIGAACAIAVCSVLATTLPAPQKKLSIYYFFYHAVNYLAQNYAHATNKQDKEVKHATNKKSHTRKG